MTYNSGWKDASEFFSQQPSWDAFLCPRCGLLPADAELVEGHDGTIFGNHPDGDGYTGVLYCDSVRHIGEILPVEEIEVRRVPCR